MSAKWNDATARFRPIADLPGKRLVAISITAVAGAAHLFSQVGADRFFGNGSGVRYSGHTLTDCEFNGCNIVRHVGSPQNLLEHLNIVRASQVNCSISEATIRDVRLTDLKRLGSAPLFLWGCLYERVTLSGRISALKINRNIGATNAEHQRAHDASTVQFYSKSDWALDISAAEFPGGVTFEAIPGDKVRRDPNRQVLVTRDALAQADWRNIDFDGTAIDMALSWFEQGSLFDNVVLVERSDRKWAKRDQAVLRKLCDAGIAFA